MNEKKKHKIQFSRTIKLRLLALEEKEGFSREEATVALIDELCMRATSSIDPKRVSEVMKKYSLSEKNARRALLVQDEFKVQYFLSFKTRVSIFSDTQNIHTIQRAKSEKRFDSAEAIEYLTKRIELKMMTSPPSPPKIVTTTSTTSSMSCVGHLFTKNKTKKRKLVKIDREKNGGEDAETSSDESTSRPEKRLRIELVKKNATKSKPVISNRTLASKVVA